MKDKLIGFKTAKVLYKKGFCNGSEQGYTFEGKLEKVYYGSSFKNGDIENNIYYEAPSQSLVQKWIRESLQLHITIFSSSQESWMYRITKPHQKLEDGIYCEDFDTYEDALEDALYEILKK